jgi:hypothetical protein
MIVLIMRGCNIYGGSTQGETPRMALQYRGTTVPREQCLAPYVTYGLGRVFTQDTAQLTHT